MNLNLSRPGSLLVLGLLWAPLLAFAGQDSDHLPLKIFLEDIAPLDRPSHHEDSMRALVHREVERARQDPAWGGQTIELIHDAAGNQLVRIPGTGRFKDSRRFSALQAHHDMVVARAVTKKGQIDLLGGVDVVETDGWIHSRDHQTTLGADNGLGVAMALTFLRDPSIEHGPLELIFTVQEEVTMIGARHLDFELKSECLLNLDSEVEGEVAFGCLGGQRTLAEAALDSMTVPRGWKQHAFKIHGLPMGHSGVQIHEARPNAAIFTAQLLLSVLSLDDVKLISLDVGKTGSLNMIPGEAQVVLSSADPEAIGRDLQTHFEKLRRTVPGAENAVLTWSPSQPRRQGFARHSGLFLARMIADLPNGVLTHDARYPDFVRSSSNLGYVKANTRGAKLGYMTRAYDPEDLASANVHLESYLRDDNFQWRRLEFTSLGSSPPWLSDRESPLMRLARRADPSVKPVLVNGGLEVAIIRQKYPDLAVISLGPTIQNPHSPKERALVASVPRSFAFLRKLLIEIGGCEDLLAR